VSRSKSGKVILDGSPGDAFGDALELSAHADPAEDLGSPSRLDQRGDAIRGGLA